jgi:hypothetical protein
MLYSRSTDWAGAEHKSVNDRLVLHAIGVAMPLADIYRWTTLGPKKPKRKRKR